MFAFLGRKAGRESYGTETGRTMRDHPRCRASRSPGQEAIGGPFFLALGGMWVREYETYRSSGPLLLARMTVAVPEMEQSTRSYPGTPG